jgi:hypothetical protein
MGSIKIDLLKINPIFANSFPNYYNYFFKKFYIIFAQSFQLPKYIGDQCWGKLPTAAFSKTSLGIIS